MDYPKLYNSESDVVVPKHFKLTRLTLLFNFSSFYRIRVFWITEFCGELEEGAVSVWSATGLFGSFFICYVASWRDSSRWWNSFL